MTIPQRKPRDCMDNFNFRTEVCWRWGYDWTPEECCRPWSEQELQRRRRWEKPSSRGMEQSNAATRLHVGHRESAAGERRRT